MSSTTFKTVCFLVLVFTDHLSSTYGQTIPPATVPPQANSSVSSTVATILQTASPTTTPVVAQSNQTRPPASRFNLSEPILPVIADYLFFSPLVNFNNRVSQAADALPKLLSQGGEQIGSLIARPIQFGTSTGNNVVSRINSTVTSVSQVVHPVVMRPLMWFGQVNSALAGMALTAVNATTSRVGQKIAYVGESISNAGQNLQHFGSSISDWNNSQTGQQELINETATEQSQLKESFTESLSITNMTVIETTTEDTNPTSTVSSSPINQNGTNLMDH